MHCSLNDFKYININTTYYNVKQFFTNLLLQYYVIVEHAAWNAGKLSTLHVHIPVLQGWISWIICQENCFIAHNRRRVRGLQLLGIYCNSRWWNKLKVDGNITFNIPSYSPVKVQLSLISSQRPQKPESAISFTFIFSCSL